MKNAIVLLVFVLCGFSLTTYCQYKQSYIDSAKVAKNAAKKWFLAWDNADITTLTEMSTEGTTTCELTYLIEQHLGEDSMFVWNKATWWGIKKDTVEGIVGFMVTPSLSLQVGENTDNPDNSATLPVFVHTNTKGKWVVNIYLSNFCLCGSPCDEDETKK